MSFDLKATYRRAQVLQASGNDLKRFGAKKAPLAQAVICLCTIQDKRQTALTKSLNDRLNRGRILKFDNFHSP
jgi:hypothetical protein